jgi:hypothetical protein
MKTRKIKLTDLKVESFVTDLSDKANQTINGGLVAVRIAGSIGTAQCGSCVPCVGPCTDNCSMGTAVCGSCVPCDGGPCTAKEELK